MHDVEKHLSKKCCDRMSWTGFQAFLRLHAIAQYFPKWTYFCDIISIHTQVKRLCTIHPSMSHIVSLWNWREWNSSPKSPTWFETGVLFTEKKLENRIKQKTWLYNTPWKNSQRPRFPNNVLKLNRHWSLFTCVHHEF